MPDHRQYSVVRQDSAHLGKLLLEVPFTLCRSCKLADQVPTPVLQLP